MRNREILGRQFRIVLELHRHAAGLSSEKLAQRIGVSRATINRDLELLRRRVGLSIERVRKTGEIWHRLRDLSLASVSATPLQVAALRLAREALAPLVGTALVGQLDALLSLLPSEAASLPGLDIVGKPQRSTARIVRAIDLAMHEGRQLEILARIAARGGEERRYVLDPLLLRVVDDDLYLFAWSHERKATRTFKVARIRQAITRDERADSHADLVPEEAFRGAVKAWSGELTRVRVRIRRARRERDHHGRGCGARGAGSVGALVGSQCGGPGTASVARYGRRGARPRVERVRSQPGPLTQGERAWPRALFSASPAERTLVGSLQGSHVTRHSPTSTGGTFDPRPRRRRAAGR
jgi:predicted DNA-binding transcriptional regulator YafY